MKYTSIVLLLITCFSCHRQKNLDVSLESPLDYKYCTEGWDYYSQVASNEDTLVYFQNCPFMGEYIFVNKYDYSLPCFNPNNPNQIAYVRHENNVYPHKNEIWVFDICNGEQKILTDIHGSGLKWGKKNWLLFKARNNMLYKVRPNGDSLTQLTFDGDYNIDASWNGRGDQFVYRKTVGGTGYCIIADENGISQDTIETFVGVIRYSWSNCGNYICSPTGTLPNMKITLFDLNTKEIKEIEHIDNDMNLVIGTDWIKDKVLWGQIGFGSNKQWKISMTDIHTKERTEIVRGFFNRQYHSLDISGDESKIIVQRRELSQISNCEIAERNFIYIMDIDGKNERRINIPEE